MNILIVESNAKCKTLRKILGSAGWRVLATGGHIERLPEDRQVHPAEEVKKAYWAHLPGQLPAPPWYWEDKGQAAVEAITNEVGRHDNATLYIATDPDREGERIAWHLYQLLAPLNRPCHRVTFQEITKTAVLAAIERVRELDKSLVNAALVRVFVDRLVGWRAKNIAKRFVAGGGNSMGRVQTPTLGFVVDRELEREAFRPVKYFEVVAKTSLADWRVRFHEKSDPDAWFDDKRQFGRNRTSRHDLAKAAHEALEIRRSLTLMTVTRHEGATPALAPFSTDAMLQAAGSRWGWSPRKTNKLASELYHEGHITYIRTDSTRIARDAVEAGREVITKAWGSDHLGAIPDGKQGAGAQDAHEAVRPTDLAAASVPIDDADASKLYALIRARTIASLMVPSRWVSLALTATCEGLDLQLEAKVGWCSVSGWRKAFEGLDEPPETLPVEVEEGTRLELLPATDQQPNPSLVEDETKPPGRYKAHSLIKAMKDAGIGRPSTYASTIETLEARKYVEVDNKNSLVPTATGRAVWLEAAPLFTLPGGSEVFRADYTAQMEELLDDVAQGRIPASEVWEKILTEFKASHERAQKSVRDGKLLPPTRAKLQDYLDAFPELAAEIRPLDSLTETEGRELRNNLAGRGLELPPSQSQSAFLERLLHATRLTLEEAIDAAGIRLSATKPNRTEASVVIDYLMQQPHSDRAATEKQLRYVADLAKKAGLAEIDACRLVGVESFRELSGGNEGSASRLIEELKKRLFEGNHN